MEKKFDNIDFFIFIATDPIFRHFWFSLLISLNNCLYLMCVKAEKFSWLLRVARAKTIWDAVYTPSWQATPREIGLKWFTIQAFHNVCCRLLCPTHYTLKEQSDSQLIKALWIKTNSLTLEILFHLFVGSSVYYWWTLMLHNYSRNLYATSK